MRDCVHVGATQTHVLKPSCATQPLIKLDTTHPNIPAQSLVKEGFKLAETGVHKSVDIVGTGTHRHPQLAQVAQLAQPSSCSSCSTLNLLKLLAGLEGPEGGLSYPYILRYAGCGSVRASPL